jgi:hypothetical protein
MSSTTARPCSGPPAIEIRIADLSLGTHQPLGECRFGHQEGARDLRRPQSTQQSEGEGDLRVGRQRRMAAGEDQSQSVVFHGLSFGRLIGWPRRFGRLGSHELAKRLDLLRQELRPSHPIDRLPPRGGGNPRSWIGRYAVERPVLERGDKGVLDRLLREVEV